MTIANLANKLGHRVTNKQTNKQTQAIKNNTSPGGEIIIIIKIYERGDWVVWANRTSALLANFQKIACLVSQDPVLWVG